MIADHPLAIAARIGRRAALTGDEEPAFEWPSEHRAFSVGRDRRLAWMRGHRDPSLARLAGCNNRSQRKALARAVRRKAFGEP